MSRRWARGVAYAVVVVGFVIWMVSGGWRNPAEQSNGGRIPLATLALAVGGYFTMSWLQDSWDDREMKRWMRRNRWRDLDPED